MTRPEAERLAVLETQMAAQARQLETVLVKLDELGALKNKGFGAFWAAAAIFGTGIVGTMAALFQWLTK